MKHQLTFGDYINRWLFSTNAKDIAVLYFIFSLFCGIVGSFMSLVLRLELAAPGNQLLMGNHQLFNVIVTAHAILMVFFLIMPVTMGFFGKGRKKIMTESNNKKIIRDKWGPYLAGLIEGDGTIVVHDGISKVKNSPIIEIVFNKKDLELANYLENRFKIGKINKLLEKDNHVLWRISKIEDVYRLITITNGYFRTPKYEALIRAIKWINNYIIESKIKVYNEKNPLELWNKKREELIISQINKLPILDIDESDIDSNGWLSGFTDGDGKYLISINNKNHKDRVNLSYRLEIRQDNSKLNIRKINNNSYYEIMMRISNLFNSQLYSKDRELLLKNQKESKKYRSYIVSINKKENLLKVSNYFNKYPLLSSKYLDYKDWESILILGDKMGSFNHPEIIEKGKKIIKNFNSSRSIITWDHLKK